VRQSYQALYQAMPISRITSNIPSHVDGDPCGKWWKPT